MITVFTYFLPSLLKFEPLLASEDYQFFLSLTQFMCQVEELLNNTEIKNREREEFFSEEASFNSKAEVEVEEKYYSLRKLSPENIDCIRNLLLAGVHNQRFLSLKISICNEHPFLQRYHQHQASTHSSFNENQITLQDLLYYLLTLFNAEIGWDNKKVFFNSKGLGFSLDELFSFYKNNNSTSSESISWLDYQRGSVVLNRNTKKLINNIKSILSTKPYFKNNRMGFLTHCGVANEIKDLDVTQLLFLQKGYPHIRGTHLRENPFTTEFTIKMMHIVIYWVTGDTQPLFSHFPALENERYASSLINNHLCSPEEALNQLKDLSQAEAITLLFCRSFGLDSDFLRANKFTTHELMHLTHLCVNKGSAEDFYISAANKIPLNEEENTAKRRKLSS